jgi:membrane protein DedA with SNARE-associated domain
MNTKNQYFLMSNTPSKEKRFLELKKKYGSMWAFHGKFIILFNQVLHYVIGTLSLEKA